jgi:hypothetical protein
VALEAALRPDSSPEERRRWLETLKQSDTDNALPNYLSALDHLQAGQTEAAVEQLLLASGKHRFQDYCAQAVEETEAAYLAAGYALADAKAIHLLQQAGESGTEGTESLAPLESKATLEQIKELAVVVRELAQSYDRAGDPTSAQAARELGVQLGQRYTQSQTDGFQQLVGSAAELIALNGMDPNRPWGTEGATVADRILLLKEQRTAIRSLYHQAAPLLNALSDEDWAAFSEHRRHFGEPAALQWVIGRYVQNQD